MGCNSSSPSKKCKIHPNAQVDFDANKQAPPTTSSFKINEESEHPPNIRQKTTLTFSNNDTYEGETLEDGVTFDGFGQYNFDGGDSYQGKNYDFIPLHLFLSSLFFIICCSFIPIFNKLTGNYRNHCRHGYGVYNYSNGNRYEG